MSKKIHVCLMSDQIFANYIPVLMDIPDEVCIITTEQMTKKGITQRFKELLTTKDISYWVYPEPMPSTNFKKILSFVRVVREYLNDKYQESDKLIINVTGGTKLMSLGFTTIMAKVAELIYTDMQSGKLEYLKNEASLTDLKSVLTVEDYLKAYGATVNLSKNTQEWREKVINRKNITSYFANNSGKPAFRNAIGFLNGITSEVLSSNGEYLTGNIKVLDSDIKKNKVIVALLTKLDNAELLKWTIDNNREIQFIDAEKTCYLNGIWLEEHVYQVANDLQLDDVQASVEVKWDYAKTKNELDVVIVHNNRILIIECKTKRYIKKDKTTEAAGLQDIYKIDSLADDLKGLYGEVWLISSRSISNSMKNRAKDRKVKLISAGQLSNIKGSIQNWLNV